MSDLPETMLMIIFKGPIRDENIIKKNIYNAKATHTNVVNEYNVKTVKIRNYELQDETMKDGFQFLHYN